MMRALYTAATGMAAQQRNIDTTANNLANVNTTGYKKSKVHFQDLLYHNERTAGVPSSVSTQVPVGLHVGHGVKFIGTEKIHTQGNLENTGNDLDLSIDGHGFSKSFSRMELWAIPETAISTSTEWDDWSPMTVCFSIPKSTFHRTPEKSKSDLTELLRYF